ncbi:MAG: hypothetical protein QOG64_2014, partial [Acidimicrobiaceae bacterium]|nr:hypothetical protein [Acidimicrobiaceae bacterium]
MATEAQAERDPALTEDELGSAGSAMDPSRAPARRSPRLAQPRVVGRRLLEISRPVGLFAASRVVTVAALAITVVVKGLPAFRVFQSWDSSWWVATAALGYPHGVPVVDGHAAASTIAFFPLLPLLTRGVMHLTGLSPLRSALLVTTLFGAATATGLWYLTKRLFGAATADRAVALFCFFPGSFVFSLVYAEPVMLALAIGCLIALLQRRWLVAGVLAALATATRPNAVVLIACCGWEAGAAILRRREWRSLVAPALAPAGIVAYFWFLDVRTGSLTAWFDVEKGGWGERIQPTALIHYVQTFARNGFAEWNTPVPLAVTVLIAVTAILLIRARVPAVVLV